MTLEALACAQDLEGLGKTSRNLAPHEDEDLGRRKRCRVYRQHQGSASTELPRNELIASSWRHNKVSERSGVSLSWTFARNKELSYILKYGKAFTVNGV